MVTSYRSTSAISASVAAAASFLNWAAASSLALRAASVSQNVRVKDFPRWHDGHAAVGALGTVLVVQGGALAWPAADLAVRWWRVR